LPHIQADFFDNRLIGCAVAVVLLHIQYLGNDPAHRHHVLVGAMRRWEVQFKKLGSPI
jgi:hypothetical protein